jgi:hypothetical protein
MNKIEPKGAATLNRPNCSLVIILAVYEARS